MQVVWSRRENMETCVGGLQEKGGREGGSWPRRGVYVCGGKRESKSGPELLV